MVNNEPQIDSAAIFELRDAARIIGVNPSTITRWTVRGLLTCRIRKVNGRRVWRGSELLRVWRMLY